jgi:hypothetical protein
MRLAILVFEEISLVKLSSFFRSCRRLYSHSLTVIPFENLAGASPPDVNYINILIPASSQRCLAQFWSIRSWILNVIALVDVLGCKSPWLFERYHNDER